MALEHSRGERRHSHPSFALPGQPRRVGSRSDAHDLHGIPPTPLWMVGYVRRTRHAHRDLTPRVGARAVNFEKHTPRGEDRVRPLPRLALLERAVGPIKMDLGQIHHLPALHGQPRPRGPHRGAACDLQGMPTCPPGKVRRGRRMLHGHQEPHSRRRCPRRGLQDAHTSWRSSHTPASSARSSERGLGAPQGELGHSHPSSCSSRATSSPRVNAASPALYTELISPPRMVRCDRRFPLDIGTSRPRWSSAQPPPRLALLRVDG